MPLKHTKKQRKVAKQQAEVAAINKIKNDSGYGNTEKKPEILTLSNYVESEYYPYLRTNRAPRTFETYKRSLDTFIRICGNRPIQAYRRNHIEQYKNHRFDKDGIKKTTINLEVRSIKAAFNWAYNRNLLRNRFLEVSSVCLTFKTRSERSKSMNFSAFTKRPKEP